MDVGAVKWCSGSTKSCPARGEEISGKMPARPTGKMPVLRLLAGFFDELAAGFDPVVVRIAGERKLVPTLGDEVGAETDLFVGRLDDLGSGGSSTGIGGWGARSRLLLGSGALFLRLGRRAFCLWLGSRRGVRCR